MPKNTNVIPSAQDSKLAALPLLSLSPNNSKNKLSKIEFFSLLVRNSSELNQLSNDIIIGFQKILADWEGNFEKISNFLEQAHTYYLNISNKNIKSQNHSLITLTLQRSEFQNIQALIKKLTIGDYDAKELLAIIFQLLNKISSFLTTFSNLSLHLTFNKFSEGLPIAYKASEEKAKEYFFSPILKVINIDLKSDFKKLDIVFKKFEKSNDVEKEVQLALMQAINLKLKAIMIEANLQCDNYGLDINILISEKLKILGHHSIKDYLDKFTTAYEKCLTLSSSQDAEGLFPYTKQIAASRLKNLASKNSLEEIHKQMQADLFQEIKIKLTQKIKILKKKENIFTLHTNEIDFLTGVMSKLNPSTSIQTFENCISILRKNTYFSLTSFINELISSYEKAQQSYDATKEARRQFEEQLKQQADEKNEIKAAVNLKIRKPVNTDLTPLQHHLFNHTLPIIEHFAQPKIRESIKLEQKNQDNNDNLSRAYSILDKTAPQDTKTAANIKLLDLEFKHIIQNISMFTINPYEKKSIKDYLSLIKKSIILIKKIKKNLLNILRSIHVSTEKNILDLISRFNLIIRELFLLLDKIEKHFDMKEGCLINYKYNGHSLASLCKNVNDALASKGFEFLPDERAPYTTWIKNTTQYNLAKRYAGSDPGQYVPCKTRYDIIEKIKLRLHLLKEDRENYHFTSTRILLEQKIAAYNKLLSIMQNKGYYLTNSMATLQAKDNELHKVLDDNEKSFLAELTNIENELSLVQKEKRLIPSIPMIISNDNFMESEKSQEDIKTETSLSNTSSTLSIASASSSTTPLASSIVSPASTTTSSSNMDHKHSSPSLLISIPISPVASIPYPNTPMTNTNSSGSSSAVTPISNSSLIAATPKQRYSITTPAKPATFVKDSATTLSIFNKLIEKRIEELRDTYFPTSIKAKKIKLLTELKNTLTEHKSLDEALHTVKSANPNTYYLLHENKTGKLLKQLETSTLSRKDMIDLISLEITRLRNEKENIFFFSSYRKAKMDERIKPLQDLQDLFHRKINSPDNKFMDEHFLKQLRTGMKSVSANDIPLLNRIVIWLEHNHINHTVDQADAKDIKDIIALISLGIAGLKNEKENIFFFASYRKANIDERIKPLQDLQDLFCSKTSNPDNKFMDEHFLKQLRTVMKSVSANDFPLLNRIIILLEHNLKKHVADKPIIKP